MNNIEKIKNDMKCYTDFYGGDLSTHAEIDSAETIEDLKNLFQIHRDYMEDMLNDAKNHLDRFEKKIGLWQILKYAKWNSTRINKYDENINK